MDKKYLCLFNKNEEQLKKELKRRGIYLPSWEYSTQQAIAEIIYKDAFDCGKNPSPSNHCPLPPTPEPEVQDYSLTHNYYEKKYHISLTTEQKALLDWLIIHNFIVSDADFEDWDDDVIEVGRIK